MPEGPAARSRPTAWTGSIAAHNPRARDDFPQKTVSGDERMFILFLRRFYPSVWIFP
jgi:hypothetical protein